MHRDLKPANIKVRADGTVKVLDFGLALEDVQEGRWFDPAFLAEIAPLSIAVTLADGDARVQDVQLAK